MFLISRNKNKGFNHFPPSVIASEFKAKNEEKIARAPVANVKTSNFNILRRLVESSGGE